MTLGCFKDDSHTSKKLTHMTQKLTQNFAGKKAQNVEQHGQIKF